MRLVTPPATEAMAATEATAASGEPEAGGDAAKDGEAPADGEAKEKGSGSEALGPTVMVGKFTINLNDPGQPRYLKSRIDVEVSSGATSDELKARKPQIRDLVLSYLSSLSIEATYGAKSKQEIRKNLKKRLNSVLTTGEIRRVFLTEFVTQ